MTDLDERLREDFAELTGTIQLDLGLTTADLIRAGRRIRRMRGARAALGATAVVIAAAAFAWPGVALLGSAVTPVVPAAPAPSRLTDSAHFTLTSLDLSDDLDRLQVDAEPAGGTGWDVTMTTSRADGLPGFRFTVRKDAEPGVITVAPRVLVQILPTRANWWNVAMKPSSPPLVYSDSMQVGGLDLTAIVLVFGDEVREGDIAGVVWAQADGQIRDDNGYLVPSTEVEVGDRSVTLYWDAPLDVLGYQSPSAFAGSAGSKTEGIAPRVLGPELDGSGETELLGDILPKGAHDLRVELRSEQAEFGTAELGGRIVYVVAHPASATGYPIRSISYRTADGTRTTLDLP